MTQKEQIINHMETYGCITPMAALDLCGCMRLASRIHEIKNDGYTVVSKACRKNGKSWSEYRLA